MIRFDPVPEPEDFQERARTPGTTWLADHPDATRPRDYWTPFKGALASAFRNLCAYSAMFEPAGTVDHFVSWHEDPSKAYEWENYRYCAAWANAASKGRLPPPCSIRSRSKMDGSSCSCRHCNSGSRMPFPPNSKSEPNTL